jgi:hypothetical protein
MFFVGKKHVKKNKIGKFWSRVFQDRILCSHSFLCCGTLANNFIHLKVSGFISALYAHTLFCFSRTNLNIMCTNHTQIYVYTYPRYHSLLASTPPRASGMAVRTRWDVVTPQQKIREERIDHVVCKCNTGRRAPKAVYLYLLATCDQCMLKGNRPTLCEDDLSSHNSVLF